MIIKLKRHLNTKATSADTADIVNELFAHITDIGIQEINVAVNIMKQQIITIKCVLQLGTLKNKELTAKISEAVALLSDLELISIDSDELERNKTINLIQKESTSTTEHKAAEKKGDAKQSIAESKAAYTGFLVTSNGDAHDLVFKLMYEYCAKKPEADFTSLLSAMKNKNYFLALEIICDLSNHDEAVKLAEILLAHKDKLNIQLNEKISNSKFSIIDLAANQRNKELCDLLINYATSLTNTTIERVSLHKKKP